MTKKSNPATAPEKEPKETANPASKAAEAEQAAPAAGSAETADEIVIDSADLAEAQAEAEREAEAALAAADASMAAEFGAPDGSGGTAGRADETEAGPGTAPEPTDPAPQQGAETSDGRGGSADGAASATGETGTQPPAAPAPAKTPRDYMAEFAELVRNYPELTGKGIPDDLAEQIRNSPRDVLSVYDHYMVGQLTKKITDLETELSRARQNAETAARAPVVGSTGSANTGGTGDPFLDSFNRFFAIN